ncbi:adenylate/guanylate cyclase domain-containing protein [Bacteroidota bacterium]
MSEDRRLAAIMFTDIVGYTALMGSDEEQAFDMLARNHTLHENLIKKHNGTLIKEIGDGTLASFPLASDAVRCAKDIQAEARSQKIPLKIGIHEGEMVMSGSDVLGDGVNIASRLVEVSQEGCITISGRVYEDVKNKAGINTRFIGEKELKNVEEPVKVYEVLCEGEVEEEITVNQEPKRFSRRLLYYAIAGLVVVISIILIWQFMPTVESGRSSPEETVVEIDRSIAILPFRSLSDDPEKQYLADGVMEAILTNLQRIEELSVRSRTSTEQYRDPDRNLTVIGRELNANYILEGSFQKIGDKAKLTVQLILAETDEHIWAEEYNRDWSDIFAVQSEVAQKIAKELFAALSPEEKQYIEKVPTNNLDAYNLYLWGHHYLNKGTKEDFEISIDYFDSAIDLDPEFALAHAGKGYSYQFLVRHSYISGIDVKLKAKEAIQKALELDPSLGQTHAIFGLIMIVFDWDIYGPEQEFQKAIKLSPGNDQVYLLYAQYLRWLGQFDRSISNINRSIELDPLSPFTNLYLAVLYSYAGRYDESNQQLEKVLDLAPDYIHAYEVLGMNYAFKGMYANAVSYSDKIMSYDYTRNDPAWLRSSGWIYAKAGKEDQARKHLEHMFELSNDQIVDPVYIAMIYAGLGDKDEAFTWLSKAVEERSGQAIYLKAYGDWVFKDLSSDPRYNELLLKVGFKVE